MEAKYSTERILVLLLAAVVSSYLLVTLTAVVACLHFNNKCTHVDFRYFLGEPLAAVLGLLAGRFSSGKQ